jgi:CheY-like chemotaxis protein
MTTPSASGSSTRVLLLVEDNPADADLVQEYLHDQSWPYRYEIHHELSRADALRRLHTMRADVILLDLLLPDSPGLEGVAVVRAAAGDTPIVVLTGTDHEELGLSCIRQGAQDYLCKSEIRPASLRRALGYAITRRSEERLRELQDSIDRYRAMLAAAELPAPSATRSLAALRDRLPEDFKGLAESYAELLEAYLEELASGAEKPRATMERLVAALGEAGAASRDLVDMHLAALVEVLPGKDQQRVRWLAIEGRLLALEMMGLLADYYRNGSGPTLEGRYH